MIGMFRPPKSRVEWIISALVLLVMLAVPACFIIREKIYADARQVLSVTRGDCTVTFVKCPECEMCARISQDAKSATVNLCRLRDGQPLPSVFARRRDAMTERVFALAAEASRAPKDFWGPDAATAWLAAADATRAVRSDGRIEVVLRDCAAARGTEREVAVRNATDAPRLVEVPLEEFGFAKGARAEAVDLTERAIPPDVEGELSVVVPPKTTKLLRLRTAK
jgi:hypothetical protein